MATLSVLIGGDDRELQAALRRAQSGMVKFGREMRSGVNDAAKYAAAMAAAGAAIAVHFVKESMQAIDAQAKLASALNTTVASLATVERAADLDGISLAQLQTGTRKLATVLGEAAQGTGTAVDSLKRLRLTADELARLPLDQRLALINERIREHIPLAEQAAVSADFFGERAGVAMLNLKPETLREAADQARLFGHALSEIDKTKVEQAGDSISRLGYAWEGFWKKISVKLAPVINQIGEEFQKAAKEAGGMEVVATRAFNAMVDAAGFVMDAGDGVRRVFVIAADAIVIALAGAEAAARKFLAAQIAIADVATFGLSETVKRWAEDNKRAMGEAGSVVRQAWDHIQETLMEPLPSESLKRFVADAEAAATAAAEAAVGGLGKDKSDGKGTGGKRDDALQKRLEKLREQFASEDELSFELREKQLEAIKEFEDAKRITAEEAMILREEAEQTHWERIGDIHEKASDRAKAIEKAKNDALKKAQADFWNNTAGLMNTQSRKVFEIGKVAAIAQALIKTKQAVIDAWQAGMSVGGPWAPAVAAAYAAAAAANGANLINNIRSQQFGGGGDARAPTQGASNVTGGGAAASDGGGGGGGSSGPTTIINLQGDSFGREQIRDLLSRLNEERKDGGRFIFA